jgi:hypothetical protein
VAIGFDTTTGQIQGSGYHTTQSWSHTCTALANRILIVQGSGLTSVTYGGVSMTAYGGGHQWYYLINPMSGANTIVVQVSGAQRIANEAISFYGVDQVNPIRAVAIDTTADSSMTCSVSAMIGDMMVGLMDHIGNNHGNAKSMNSPLTTPYDRFTVGAATVAFGISFAVGHGVATTSPESLTCVQDGWATNYWQGVALRPYVPALGRGVKYYFNIWDPRAEVKDRNARVVPPNELRADNWLELQGVALPDPKVYTTYVEDPTKAYIVEVTASDTAATLRASRNQFADTLIKRAAAGRG